jgi:hypothetical protein
MPWRTSCFEKERFMTNRSFTSKTNLSSRRVSGHIPSRGGDAAALAPPAYGIDFVDGAAPGAAPVQRVGKPEEEELKPPVQGKFEAGAVQREQEPAAGPSSNLTGMPDGLKANMESLSGLDLSDVRVNFNSPKPAQLEAVAYTQGNDIHVAPGQEKHLAHEAWHVVQQRQGRVQPTMELEGTRINDDAGLEKEADVMGERAARGS